MSASYNDWESDLSSIIEKTNQNLKLLRRIGEKRSDDVSVIGTAASSSRPSSSLRMDAGDLRTAVHHRYAAEDAAATYRPRVMSSAAGSSSRKLNDTRSMRAAATMREVNYDSDDLHSARSVRRSVSAKTLKTGHAAPIRVHGTDMPSDVPNYVLDEMKKSLEVTIASRSGAFEKRLSDLRTDFTVLTTETTALSHKFGELRDAVATKLSSVPSVLQRLDDAADAITRLEKHSSALLGWKVSTDQDVFELSAKVKTLASLQDKMVALEGNLESLATALKNRPRQDEKIAQLQDKLAALERQQASFVDLKTVESALAMRLPRELHDVESRVSQSIAFVTEKLEAKVQSLEKAVTSQRAESIASLKSELVDDLQRLAASTLRKGDVVPLQHAQTQLRDDFAQLSSVVERHDKRTQDVKQTTTQLRDELSETKQELLKTLSAQQTRVSATLDDRLAQLSDAAKAKAAKVEQQVAALSKKHKRTEDATRALQADIVKIQKDALAKQTASESSHEREHEALRLRLARSVAELETLSHAKTDLERRYAKQEKQLTTKLKALQAKAAASEIAQETERQALVQRIQDETKAMGVAQGKAALLETLLANEKRQHSEKSELVRVTRQEMLALRQRMQTVESDAERARQKLSTELHAKQQQVETLRKKLAKSEADAAKALDTATRDAAQLRRLKVAKEHELRLAKLRFEELERATAAVPPAASVETVAKSVLDEAESKRRELERLLLDAQLQVDELTQELEKTRHEREAASVQRRLETAEQLETLTREYETQLTALNDAVAAKDEAMRRVRETLVDKSALDALDAELCGLRDEKTALTAALERAQRDHARAMREHATEAHAAHAMEIESLAHTLETRTVELEDVRAAFDPLKRTIATLEQQLSDHATTHADELATLTADVTESRATIASLTTDVATLRTERTQLELELESVQSELETVRTDADARSTAKDEQLMEQEAAMQRQIEDLTRQLDGAESTLAESKCADETNRQKLLDIVAAQEASEASLKSEIDMLLLTLEHERANSHAREQELTATITSLEATKLASADAEEASQAAMASVSDALMASEGREQALQRRIASIVSDVTQAASAFGGDASMTRTDKDGGDEDTDKLVAQSLAHFSATHRSTVLALERLQADYERALAQATDDASTIQDLEVQMKRLSAQVADLETVVNELETKLKDQYAQSAQHSDDLEREIVELKTQTAALERAVANKTSECEAKQAALELATEHQQTQSESLRTENARLTATIASIRASIERVEASKMRELDAMSTTLSELELHAATLTASVHASASAELDRDVYAITHRESVTLAQRIRSLQVELTKSASVVEWHDLRASVFDEEQRLERLALDRSREVAKIAAAEDEILLNADFLRALMALRGADGDGSGSNGAWMRKYVTSAPDMAERLKSLESRLHDAVALASERVSAARGLTPVNTVESALASSNMSALRGTSARVVGSFERRLSDSCDDASSDVLEASQDADTLDNESEQSMLESVDESDCPSESAAGLDESSLDASAQLNDDVDTANELPQPKPAHDEVVDACTTLLLGHAPSELLANDFARRETSVEITFAHHATEVGHASSRQSDSEQEDDEEEDVDDATDDDEAHDATEDAAARSPDTRSHEPDDHDLTASPSVRTLSTTSSSDSHEVQTSRESASGPVLLAAHDDADEGAHELSERFPGAREDHSDDELIDSEDDDDEADAQDGSDDTSLPVQASANVHVSDVGDSSRRMDDAVRHDEFDEESESDGEHSRDAADTRALELALERRAIESATESVRRSSAEDDRSALVNASSDAAAARVPSFECDRKEDVGEDADELLASMDETRSEEGREDDERELKTAALSLPRVARTIDGDRRDALDAHDSDDENLSEFDHVPAHVEAVDCASESDDDDVQTGLELDRSTKTRALRQEHATGSSIDVAGSRTFRMEEDDESDDETQTHEVERPLLAEPSRGDEQQRTRDSEDFDDEDAALSESLDRVDDDRDLESSFDDARDLERSVSSLGVGDQGVAAVAEDKLKHAPAHDAAPTYRFDKSNHDVESASRSSDDEEGDDEASIDESRTNDDAHAEQALRSTLRAVAARDAASDLTTLCDDDDASDSRFAMNADAKRSAQAHELYNSGDDSVDNEVDDDLGLDHSAESEQLETSLDDDRLDGRLLEAASLEPVVASLGVRVDDRCAAGKVHEDDEDEAEDDGLDELAQRVHDETAQRAQQSSTIHGGQRDVSDDELIDSDSDDDVDEDTNDDSQASVALPSTDLDSKRRMDDSSNSVSGADDESFDDDAHSHLLAHEGAEEAKALAGQFSGMETASTASGHSQDDDTAPFYRATPADARIIQDAKFAFDARRLEPSLPAAPTRLQTNTLAPLRTLSRLSGAGALKKALSAATRTYDDDEDDDDMGEVERIMVAQSLTRPSSSSPASVIGLSASYSSKALGKATRSAFEPSDDDGDDDEFRAPASLADAHRELTASRARQDDDGAEGDDFEDHDLASSPRDEHDESFDGDTIGSKATKSSGISMTSRSFTASSSLSSRSQLSRLSLGRRVTLEEDDDMDDVERLLLEQTPMLQPTTTHNDLRKQAARHGRGDADDDDDEFGDDERLETSEQELSSSCDDQHAAATPALDDSLDNEQTLRALERTLDRAPQRHYDDHDAISDSSESESESDSAVARVSVAQQPPQRPLASLGLGAARMIGRMRLEEDDDMDEVERLLHAQTSKKHPTSASVTMRSAQPHDLDDDDEFGEASLEAAVPSAAHTDDDDTEDGGAIDSESDEENERQPPSRSGSLSSRNGDASSPSAATRIPILSGSNLVDRVASDAIPSMLASPVPAPLSASAEAVESEIQSQVAHLSPTNDEEEDDNAYLEESFDLEESLQDDDGD